MGYSTFISFGVKEVLLGAWDLLSDGYLLIPSSLFASLLTFTIPVAAGKMGLLVLNSVGLALVGDYLIGHTFPVVASTVYQAYISRAIQSNNWDNIRSTFQRTALIWLTLFFLIQVPILCNWDLILMLEGQDHQLAHIAQEFVFIQLPRYFAMYVANLLLMTLFAHDSVWPTLLSNALNFVLVVIVEVLVIVFNADVYLLAVGVCVAQLLTTAVVILIFLAKLAQCGHLDVLRFEAASWFDWSEMFCQSVLSIMQHAAMRLIVEVVVIIGGLLSHVELGAATILRRYTAFVSSVPLNLMAPVVCKSIGASIGKRSHVSVKVYICSGLSSIFLIGLLITLASVLFRKPIAAFMTSESEVVEITAHLTIVVSILDWIMLVYMTNIFVFRGLGSMAFPTIIGLCFQYGFSLPLAILLVFVAHMRLSGYYVALCISFLMEFLVDSGYLHLFKLPALVLALESSEQQPLIGNDGSPATAPTSDSAPSAPSSPADVVDVGPQEAQASPKYQWAFRCWLLVCAALCINCFALGIHFMTNYLLD